MVNNLCSLRQIFLSIFGFALLTLLRIPHGGCKTVHPANCSGWIPINNTKVWECGYDSYIKLGPLKGNNCSTIKLLLDRCTDCNGLLTSCRCEGTTEKRMLGVPIIFLYGIAIGASSIFFPTLLFVVILRCYKMKKRKDRSLSEQNEMMLTETQDTRGEDFSPPKRSTEVAETQKVGQQESSKVKGEPTYENVNRKARDDSLENGKVGAAQSHTSEAAENGNECNVEGNVQGDTPSGKTIKGRKGYLQMKQKKTGEKHPLYENCNVSRRYKHLMPENKKQNNSPDEKSTGAEEKKDVKDHLGDIVPMKTEKKLPRKTGTKPPFRPSSAEYVNAHMGKLLGSFGKKQTE